MHQDARVSIISYSFSVGTSDALAIEHPARVQPHLLWFSLWCLPSSSVDESTVEKSAKFAAFRDAARRGAAHQDCQQAYATKCPKGLREYLSTKY